MVRLMSVSTSLLNHSYSLQGLWKSAVLSAEVPREANEPVDKKNICVALFVVGFLLHQASRVNNLS